MTHSRHAGEPESPKQVWAPHDSSLCAVNFSAAAMATLFSHLIAKQSLRYGRTDAGIRAASGSIIAWATMLSRSPASISSRESASRRQRVGARVSNQRAVTSSRASASASTSISGAGSTSDAATRRTETASEAGLAGDHQLVTAQREPGQVNAGVTLGDLRERGRALLSRLFRNQLDMIRDGAALPMHAQPASAIHRLRPEPDQAV